MCIADLRPAAYTIGVNGVRSSDVAGSFLRYLGREKNWIGGKSCCIHFA